LLLVGLMRGAKVGIDGLKKGPASLVRSGARSHCVICGLDLG